MKWIEFVKSKTQPPGIVVGYDFAAWPDQSALIAHNGEGWETIKLLPQPDPVLSVADWTPGITAAAPVMPDLTEELAKLGKAMAQAGKNVGEVYTAVKALSKQMEPAAMPPMTALDMTKMEMVPSIAVSLNNLIKAGLMLKDVSVSTDYSPYGQSQLDVHMVVVGDPHKQHEFMQAVHSVMGHAKPKGFYG